MTTATYICRGDVRREVDVALGTNLMRAACDNGIEEIMGECGGAMTCATCHVYVDDRFLGALSPMEPNEDQILDFTASARQPNSRLACQITMTEALDGIVVRVAPQQ